MGIVLTRGFGAGDRLVILGDFVERAGELVTDECGLDLMRMGSYFGSCLISGFISGLTAVCTVIDSCTGDDFTVIVGSDGLTVIESSTGSGSGSFLPQLLGSPMGRGGNGGGGGALNISNGLTKLMGS